MPSFPIYHKTLNNKVTRTQHSTYNVTSKADKPILDTSISRNARLNKALDKPPNT